MEKLLISACLIGENCKYSGGSNVLQGEQLRQLQMCYELIPVCPEQLGGLPTPRTPAERRGDRVITRDGRDVTAEFYAGAEQTLTISEDRKICKALLKSRSPSCGRDRIYDGTFTGTLIRGNGVTAQTLIERGISVYTEEEIAQLI